MMMDRPLLVHLGSVLGVLSLPFLTLLPARTAQADEGVCESAEDNFTELMDLGGYMDAVPASAPTSAALCSNECGPKASGRGRRREEARPGAWAGDGECDDGGPGAANSECDYGTDCLDCGVRGCDEETPCSDGQTCKAGSCAVELGPIPDCDAADLATLEVPEGRPWELAQFEPDRGDGYWDYSENGESEDDQYRSYLRRDVQQMVKYAAAWTRCLSQDWEFGNQEPLGLGDMSEGNGAIPGARERDPGHPSGSHVDGKDIDIAYYQLHDGDNLLRPICEHTDSRGREQSHCVSAPNNLDVFRTALFLAKLHDSPRVRVIGVDGQAGPLIEDAFDQLCAEGWLDKDSSVCRGGNKLAYETVDRGSGWFRHHHHHFHLSTYGGSGAAPSPGAAEFTSECLVPGCPALAQE
jgi:hypothetical protein